MNIHKTYKSPHDWYIVTIVERFEKLKEDKRNMNRRCTAWENTILVKANDILHAYDKVVKYQKEAHSEDIAELDGNKGRWIFEGVADIFPIYEELEDMAEISWTEHKRVAVKNVKSSVFSRKELEKIFSTPPSRFHE